MAAPDVRALIVAYLRKHGLTKACSAFIKETKFKDAGLPAEDLEAIYGSYLSTKAGTKKRKTGNGAADPQETKTKLLDIKPASSSSSGDSESDSIEEQKGLASQKVAPRIVLDKPLKVTAAIPNNEGLKASNRKSKGVVVKQSPSARDESSSDDSDAEEVSAIQKTQATGISFLPASQKAMPSSSQETSSSDDESADEDNNSKITAKQQSNSITTAPTPTNDESSSDGSSPEDDIPVKKTILAESSSSEDSSEDEAIVQTAKEPLLACSAPKVNVRPAKRPVVPVSVPRKLKASGQLSKRPVLTPSAGPNPNSFLNQSSSSDEESEDVPTKDVAKKQSTCTPKTPTPANDESSSDDSDSEGEVPITKTTVTAPSKESSSSSSEESEEEEPIKKSLATAPSKQLPPAEENSSSDEESEEEARKAVVKKGAVVGKQSAPVSVAKFIKQQSGGVQDGSSSDDDKHRKIASSPLPKVAVTEVQVTLPSKGKKRKRDTNNNEENGKSSGNKLVQDSQKIAADDSNGTLTKDVRNGAGKKRHKLSHDSGEEAKPRFQKINVEEVEYADARLQDNSYWGKVNKDAMECRHVVSTSPSCTSELANVDSKSLEVPSVVWHQKHGAEAGWGAKAQEVLGQVRGKGFRKEKTKKKRGTYKGGAIDFNSHSIKFVDSDQE